MQHDSLSDHSLSAFPLKHNVTTPLLAGGALALVLDGVLTTVLNHHSGFPLAQFAKDAIGLSLISAGIIVGVKHLNKTLAAQQAAITKTRQQYQQVLDEANRAILLFALSEDKSAQCIKANTFATRLLGYNADEFLSLDITKIFSDERQGDATGLITYAIEHHNAQLETILIDKTGQQIPAECYACYHDDEVHGTICLYIHDIRDQRHLEESLREARTTSQAVAIASPFAIISLDSQNNVTAWNQAAETIFGWKEYEIFSRHLPFVTDDITDDFNNIVQRTRQQESVSNHHCQLQRQNGEIIATTLSAAPIIDSNGETEGVTLIIADTTWQQDIQAELTRTSRACTMLSETKKALFRASDEETLLANICESLQKFGGYCQTWIAVFDDDHKQVLRPAACAGDGIEYIKQQVFHCTSPTANKNPITKAINEGNTVLLDDIRTATTDAPWLRGLCDYGVKSLIAIPLFIGWRPYGVLVVSVGNDNTYHKNDIELLNEFADDLAYGIEALRLRLAHDQAQNALVTAAHQWRTTFDTLSDLLCIVDRNGNITHSNQAAIQFFDKKCEELVNAPICQLLHQETEKPERCAMVEAMTTGLPAVESLEIGDRWYNITIQPIFDEDGNVQGAIHLMSDFTARKLADEKLEQNYRRLQRIMNDTIAAIAKIAEMRDPYTAGHERRVSELACAIGHELQMTPDQLEGLRVAGILHDIGKLYVPAEMLSKSGKLSDVEFGVIRAHTEAGYEILQSIDFPWPIAQMVLQHHERMDGTGYPNGLSGNDILLEARILAVADVVESMASHRPYRPSRGLESALSEIESKSGTAFDPEVVQVCIRLFREQGYTFTK